MPRLNPAGALAEDSRVVTVWSDIGCPWASLALHVLRREASTRGIPLLVDHRAFPLELFNRRPTPRPIIDAEIVAIVGLVPELGWRVWSGPSWHYPASTLPALEAVHSLKDGTVGGLIDSDRLDSAIRRAWYTDGRCITMASVLEEIAAEVPRLDMQRLSSARETGSSRSAVFADWREAETGTVQGSPHFFGPGGQQLHNPGVTYHWTKSPDDGGVPRFERYDESWVDEVLQWTV